MDALARTKLNATLRRTIEIQILTRPWFTRVWVYQELVLSRTSLVQCGRYRVRWDGLYNLFFQHTAEIMARGYIEGLSVYTSTGIASEPNEDEDYLGYRSIRKLQPENKAVPAHSGMNEAVRMFSDMHAARDKKKGSPSVLSILKSRKCYGVSDLRDIIFGHLAAANLPSATNDPPCPKIDYQCSVLDVFMDAARFIAQTAIRVKHNINYIDLRAFHDILGLAGVAQRSSHALKELPSWVPDWSLPMTARQTLLPPAIAPAQILNVSRYFELDAFHVPHGDSLQPSVLIARFFRAGGLSQIEKIIKEMDANVDPQTQTMLEEAQKQFPIVIDHGTYPLSFLLGRRIATRENGMCVVPQSALSQDVIYALPLSGRDWSCFVLRQLPLESGTREVGGRGSTLNEKYDLKKRHFTLVEQALIQHATFEVAVDKLHHAWRLEEESHLLGELVFIH
ncbi:hypothetical protein IFR04_007336 [Cadophora malorum]|uniref:Heterokaryon incompatibility domain-containing protein n=1 Tax=Cadophora malorum TaxID=108018 RepID=A0A8H7TH64_9HELO|nr:hypothetical protein IFR04_007336 [Cadophora malorum]